LKPHVLRGSAHTNSFLSDEDVLMIRHLHQKGLSNGQIAIRYGANRSTISRIINYKTYANIK